MFAEFHFLRPIWLLAIIPVILLALLLYAYRRDQSPWHSLIAPHLQPLLLNSQQALKKQPWLFPSLILCWCISVLALAGPSWQKLPQPAFGLKKATVLVLDMSMSMRATDMAPDRLTQQRFLALDFTKQLKEGELGLLSFAGDAFIIAPLTPDHNNISLLIPDLQPEIMPVQGSNLYAALQQADKLLTQAGYPRGDVVVFTDGFDDNSYNDIQKLLNSWPHRLSILGFGTTEGAPVQLANGELLKNTQGAVILPKVPQQQLASLAKRHGGIYANASIDGQGIKQILAQTPLSALDSAEQLQQIQGDQWQDAAIYLVWLLIPLLLWQRRYGSLLTLVIFILPAPAAQAIEWRDLWQTQQQQARQDYQNGDFAAAKEKFTDPLWQGNAAYRAGDYQTAEQAFNQAATLTNTAEAWHNLGNSLAQQERYADAAKAYEQALAINPELTAAADNAKLMQQLLEQQQQKQQEQQSNNQSSQSDQDKQQQSGQQEQQQNSEQDPAENAEDNSTQSQQQSEGANAEQDPNNNQAQSEANNAQQANEKEQQARQQDTNKDKASEEQMQQQAAISEAWPDATPEQQQQLNNLLRKVQDDPALLLRNKMYLEYQKRQHQRLPKGVVQQW